MKKILKQSKLIASSVAMILLLPACSNSVSIKPEVDLPKQSAFFKHFDSNNDQKVTVDEFIAARSGQFKGDDKDGNGVLSQREYITASHTRQRARKVAKKLERKNKSFAKMDTDNDGTVDENEFIARSQVRAQKSFAKMDSDANGLINNDEYINHRHKDHKASKQRESNPHQMFVKMDTNKDGQLSQNERNVARMKWFDSMDINGDKVVTPEEVELAREERKKS